MPIISGKQQRKHFVVIHGTPGIGKSTFLSGPPKTVFIQSEDGTSELNVSRYTWGSNERCVAESWSELNEAVDWLQNEKHDFEYAAFDTLDGFEPLAWQELIRVHPPKKQQDLPIGMKTIEVYGYGKGYRAVIDELWLPLLKKIERLNMPVAQGGRNMGILISAHTGERKKTNLDGDDYLSHSIQCHNDLANLFKNAAQTVLFATEEVVTMKADGAKKAKAVGRLPRICKTTDGPTWDAKNRFGLPPEIVLDWNEFERLARGESAADVVARIMAIEVDSKLADKRTRELAAAGSDVEKLRRFENWLKSKAVKVDA